jgi:predicted dehydrogenase
VQFHMGQRTRGMFSASQVSAGRKNRLFVKINGTKTSVARNQECPDELDLPSGHREGYDDTFKQVFRRFYQSISDPEAPPEYPCFEDRLRQLEMVEAELESNRTRARVEVSA